MEFNGLKCYGHDLIVIKGIMPLTTFDGANSLTIHTVTIDLLSTEPMY